MKKQRNKRKEKERVGNREREGLNRQEDEKNESHKKVMRQCEVDGIWKETNEISIEINSSEIDK